MGKSRKNNATKNAIITLVNKLQNKTFSVDVFLTALATKKSAVPQEIIARIPKNIPNKVFI